MNKLTSILTLFLVVSLLWLNLDNRATIKQLNLKLSDMMDECVVARDVESPILIIGIPEEEK